MWSNIFFTLILIITLDALASMEKLENDTHMAEK
jgi:hypothetical protein